MNRAQCHTLDLEQHKNAVCVFAPGSCSSILRLGRNGRFLLVTNSSTSKPYCLLAYVETSYLLLLLLEALLSTCGITLLVFVLQLLVLAAHLIL
jgi:hypothetical protein